MPCASKPTHEQVKAFLADLEAVYEKHQLGLERYYVQYDEYDSDEGFYVVPLRDADSLYLVGRKS